MFFVNPIVSGGRGTRPEKHVIGRNINYWSNKKPIIYLGICNLSTHTSTAPGMSMGVIHEHTE